MPIQLKVRMFWLPELAMRDCKGNNEANELWFQSIRGLYEISPGLITAEGATNGSWAAKLGYYGIHIMHHHLSDILRSWDVCPYRMYYYDLWKLLTAF